MKFRKILAVLLALALLPGLLPSASADHVHSWRLQATRREPTCTEPGTGVYVCNCGQRKTDALQGNNWAVRHTADFFRNCSVEGFSRTFSIRVESEALRVEMISCQQENPVLINYINLNSLLSTPNSLLD